MVKIRLTQSHLFQCKYSFPNYQGPVHVDVFHSTQVSNVVLLFFVEHYRFETDEDNFIVSKLDIILGGGESKIVWFHLLPFISTQYCLCLDNLVRMPSLPNLLQQIHLFLSKKTTRTEYTVNVIFFPFSTLVPWYIFLGTEWEKYLRFILPLMCCIVGSSYLLEFITVRFCCFGPDKNNSNDQLLYSKEWLNVV